MLIINDTNQLEEHRHKGTLDEKTEKKLATSITEAQEEYQRLVDDFRQTAKNSPGIETITEKEKELKLTSLPEFSVDTNDFFLLDSLKNQQEFQSTFANANSGLTAFNHERGDVYNVLLEEKIDTIAKVKTTFQFRNTLTSTLNKLALAIINLQNFVNAHLVPLQYVDNDTYGFLVTDELVAENQKSLAQLAYYEEAANWLRQRGIESLSRATSAGTTTPELLKKAFDAKQKRDRIQTNMRLAIDLAQQQTGYLFVIPLNPNITNASVLSIDDGDEQQKLEDFKSRRDAQLAQLQKDQTNLQDISNLETMDPHDNQKLKEAKEKFLAERASYVPVDDGFDGKVDRYYNEYICKSNFITGSASYNQCIQQNCASWRDILPQCKTLFKTNPLKEQCKDFSACQKELLECKDEDECNDKITPLLKNTTSGAASSANQSEKSKEYCETTFGQINPRMKERCEQLKCESDTTNPGCTNLQKNVSRVLQKKEQGLDTELSNLIGNIPKLILSQDVQDNITDEAKSNTALEKVWTRMQNDLKAPDPATISEIGPLVHRRRKTLLLIQQLPLTILETPMQEWTRWITDVVNVMQQHCSTESCLQRVHCKDYTCKELN